jgi:hypothetical protein
MKIFTSIVILVISVNLNAQLQPGFEPEEARDLTAICNSYTFLELYEDDTDIIPKDYKKKFTSETIGMDNQFQIYTKGKIGVIHFRGSTSQVTSWIENMYSAMIPAKGVVKINNKEHTYQFASDTLAAVHSGYALAILLQAPSLLEQIKRLNAQGIHSMLITGHSQGGALATLCRTYLEHLPSEIVSDKNKFKTYSFASPMVGNKAFAEEYNAMYSANKTSFRIINPADMIHEMPVHYDEDKKLINTERIFNTISGKEKLSLKKLGVEFVARNFERTLANHIGFSNRQIERFVSKAITSLEMPEYTKDINYYKAGEVMTLRPFIYPTVAIEESQLSEYDLTDLLQDDNGTFYKKEPAFFQHKPYNYYVGVLQKYLPKEYDSLKRRYLQENL